MTKPLNEPRSAILVIDMQNDVVSTAHERDAVIARIAALVETARGHDVPMIWVRHSSERLVAGSAGWQLVPELVPLAGEAIIEKHYGDAFEDTTLDGLLRDHGVSCLYVAGAQTDFCVRSTLHGAFLRGYDAMLVSDAHTTEDLTTLGAPPPHQVIAHTNLYWRYQRAPGRTAGTVRSDEVECAKGAAGPTAVAAS